MANNKLVIEGRLIGEEGRTLHGLRIESWVKDVPAHTILGESLCDEEGNYRIVFERSRYKTSFPEGGPFVFFKIFEGDNLIHITATSLLPAPDPDLEDFNIWIDIVSDTGVDDKTCTVSGHIVDSNGAALGGYAVEVFVKSLDRDMLVAKTVSGEEGNYSQEFSPTGIADLPDIEVHAFESDDAEHFTRSEVKYNVTGPVTIDVIVPVDKVTPLSEFETIVRALRAHLGSLALSELKEDEETQHISFLSNKSGYDARVVAMIASAHKIGESLEIKPSHVYALHRAGVPGNKDAVRSLSSEKVEEILTTAIEKNIIPASDIAATIERLDNLSIDFVLNGTQGAAVSTMAEMLNLRLNNDNQKRIFAETFKRLGTDSEAFWNSLEQQGIDSHTIGKLQLDGKLGFLTGQNAPLIEKIQTEFSITNDADLVRSGLYKAAEWKALMTGSLVPAGVDIDDYASHLANRVRLSYPNLIAGEMLNHDEINLGDNVPKAELLGFLSGNHSVNTLGERPVQQWEGFQDLTVPAKAAAKTFERLYQITPSDESMKTLSGLGLTSAYQVARFTKNEFLAAHGTSFPSFEEAEQTYTKANEIYNASLIITTGYLTQRSMPNVYAITGAPVKTAPDTVALPTLEDLLGNMDYCSCDNCKSVLSPAAYLVDLLQFIDLSGIPHTKMNPIDAFGIRRPDIENILLSCENTNTALPYIDLVNEILEYYVLHNNLIALEGHDVAEDAKQADLLAEPQFVEKQVYENNLKQEVFPYNLPFHQPLETLRRLFNMWGTSLETCLGVFSSPFASRKEALNCNEEEYKTLTDITYKQLAQYFGEAAGTTLNDLDAAISNGKEFSRRAGISYEQLVVLLKTNFINPGAVLMPLFQELKISLAQLQQFYDGTITWSQLQTNIPDAVDPGKYGGDIQQWLGDNHQLIMGLILLTDIGAPGSECNFAEVALRYALPDSSANKLTTTAYHKFHRFFRLMEKTGWGIETLDAVIKPQLPIATELITDANIDSTFTTLLDRIANFRKLAGILSYSEKKYAGLLLILDSANTLSLRQDELAKILKMSVPDLIELSEMTRVDPFAADFEADEPSLTGFITLAQSLKANGLKIADLAYILRSQDPTGKLTPNDETLLKYVNLLKGALNTVEKDINAAPANMDFTYAKSKMLLVYDAVATDKFFGLFLGTNIYTELFITDKTVLPLPLTATDPNLGFNSFKKTLSYNGILTLSSKTALENSANALVLADIKPNATPAELAVFQADFIAALQLLFDAVNDDLADFGTNYPALEVIYNAAKAENGPAAQAQKIVDLILPDLKTNLKLNAIGQQLIGITKAAPEIISVISNQKDVIHAESDATKGVVYDFMQLEDKIVFDQAIQYDFYLDVPATDEYIFYLSGPAGAKVTFTVDGDQLLNNKIIGANGEENTVVPVLLKAGELHVVQLNIINLPSNGILLSWRTNGMAKTLIPDSAFYDLDKVNFAKLSLIRITKTAQLAKLLKLTALELGYFAVANIETKDFLNEIPAAAGISPANVAALWQKIKLLVYFQTIKKENEPAEHTWLAVLLDPDLKNAQNQFLLESFNNWKEPDLAEVLTKFGFARANLSSLSILRTVIKAMKLVAAIGYPAVDSLIWITNDPTYDEVAGIKATIKQTVAEAAWLESIQTVSDGVRNLLRDALVDYILQYKRPSPEISTPDKLYEYFLVDVEMDACMKTSRIRLALSAVQLFIQRCLMNLEPDVASASIRAEQWDSMGRYVVWAANRNVYLFPENYMEEAIRDNKSPLFKELEGQLLQQEITDESAELAFLNYLKKLDEIAKLEMVGMYLEENEKGNQDDDILHVIGRTLGNTRRHYYRRYEFGYWTPWELISLNIEGEHVFPIVWKKQLFVFWLNTVEKGRPSDTKGKRPVDMGNEAWGDNISTNIEVNICWGEYEKGKWTSPKSTDMSTPMILAINGLIEFDKRLLVMYGRKERVENPPGKFRERLIIDVSYGPLLAVVQNGHPAWVARGGKFIFTSKNAPPFLDSLSHDQELADGVINSNNEEFLDAEWELHYNRLLKKERDLMVRIAQPPTHVSQPIVNETVFIKNEKLTSDFSLLTLHHPVERQFEAPFSYADEHSTLFAEPDERLFYPIWSFTHYYADNTVSTVDFEPRNLIRAPISGWPPAAFNRGQTGVIADPWSGVSAASGFNDNLRAVLPGTTTFAYDGVVFNSGGPAARRQ